MIYSFYEMSGLLLFTISKIWDSMYVIGKYLNLKDSLNTEIKQGGGKVYSGYSKSPKPSPLLSLIVLKAAVQVKSGLPVGSLPHQT